jgi:hypothetical protein
MKVKLTESDLTNIVRKILKESEEDLTDTIEEYRKKYDEICYNISESNFDDLYYHINSLTRELYDNYDVLKSFLDEGSKNSELIDLIDNYKNRIDDLNRIWSILNEVDDIKTGMY